MKKAIFIFGFLTLLLIIGFFTYKKEVYFDKYAKIKALYTVYDFGNANLLDTVKYEYKIKNISNYPFVIVNVKSESDVFFKNTIIKKIIDSDEEASVYVQYVPYETGKVERVIEIESNSSSGIIRLILKGTVNQN